MLPRLVFLLFQRSVNFREHYHPLLQHRLHFLPGHCYRFEKSSITHLDECYKPAAVETHRRSAFARSGSTLFVCLLATVFASLCATWLPTVLACQLLHCIESRSTAAILAVQLAVWPLSLAAPHAVSILLGKSRDLALKCCLHLSCNDRSQHHRNVYLAPQDGSVCSRLSLSSFPPLFPNSC